MHQINTLEIVDTFVAMLIGFVGFMLVYLFATVKIYIYRYKTSIKKVEGYVESLKTAHSMFEREEKLKG